MNFLFGLSIYGYKILAIPWNIFLALVPCLIVYYLHQAMHTKTWVAITWFERLAFVFIFLFWFFFFPNITYLFMAPRHLVNYCSTWDANRVCIAQSWVVIFFTTYAVIGIPFFYYALNRMSILFGKFFGSLFKQLLPIIVIPFASIGMMFGLFGRYNSWDVLRHPLVLIQIAFGYLTNIIFLMNFLVFTISLYLIYYGLDIFIWKIIKKK